MFRIAPLLLIAAISAPAVAAESTPDLRDPFQPPNVKSSPASKAGDNRVRWRLESTMIIGDRRLAKVNGRMVKTGQFVNGARVVRIMPGEVVLAMEGVERRISILGSTRAVKTPAD